MIHIIVFRETVVAAFIDDIGSIKCVTAKFIAIVGEALYLAGVGPRVAYPMFDEDFEVLGAYAWIDNHIVRYPSLEPI